MPVSDMLKQGEEKMQKTIAETKKEFTSIRTGRANPMILDKINVDYYGTATPLRQVSNLSVQDGQTLVIQPYDKSALSTIEKAILKSDLGVTPNNDGVNIRITFPPLTEERRKDLVKTVKKIGEDNKVAIRNIRRDMTDALKKLEKSENIPEDEIKKHQDQIQKVTDKYTREIDTLVAEKEKEVLAV
ncbi:MAG: ribosome recycling factor [Candidatus Melainabacteria bacterium RIFOXYA12_FULL_32_12]|nr:MAG: ribosome recycling factor [Candidatus Melainabacteria bacterium GWF2_32_7]OGI22997.1 MAG: ribosome recycling factor [Candidatus Melainabacteria bacterium RIFOXYA2_FULL_32_9]OGI28378.1 MAG: ribosome recycling factor [Candidatus Melainabacteria bacterium RIFOXYA12_FULL_32_12]